MSGTCAFGCEDMGVKLFGLRLGFDCCGISEEGSEQGFGGRH